MKAATEQRLTEPDIRKVAVEAEADPRTVRKVLKGITTRSMASRRVAAVLRRMGISLVEDRSSGARR